MTADRGTSRPDPDGRGQTERNVGGREAGKPDKPERDDGPTDDDESTERNVGG